MLGRGCSGLAPIWIPLLSFICLFLPLALEERSCSKSELGVTRYTCVLSLQVKVLTRGIPRLQLSYVSQGGEIRVPCSGPNPDKYLVT